MTRQGAWREPQLDPRPLDNNLDELPLHPKLSTSIISPFVNSVKCGWLAASSFGFDSLPKMFLI